MTDPLEGELLLIACFLIGVLAAVARFHSGKSLVRTLIVGNLSIVLLGGYVHGFAPQVLAGLAATALTATLVVCVFAASIIGAVRWIIDLFRSR